MKFLSLKGKSWFPIGVWGVPSCKDPLRWLADAGFNLVVNPPHETAWDDRLSVIRNAGACNEQFRQYVEATRDEPNLIGWVCDEPCWNGIPLERVRAAYAAVRELTPDRIFWQTQAPQNSVAGLTEYAQYCDVTGVNIYPVGHRTHSSLPNRTLGVVGDEVKKQHETCDKPVWAVLQGFGWGVMEEKPPDGRLTPPTWEETRLMAYDAIRSGATGIIYFGANREPLDSDIWKSLCRIAHELADIQPEGRAGP